MATVTSAPEARWIAWLKTTPDARKALRAFCPHYLYFSKSQVIAFTGLFKQVDPLDRDSLAMLADVLHEELGRGTRESVHSVLFERFAIALGVTSSDLHIDASQVLPGVRAYVAELDRAFSTGSRSEALATYLFLESSAVQTYGPLLESLLAIGLPPYDVEFFRLHAGVEPEHAAAAEAMLARHGLSVSDLSVATQIATLTGLWHSFWSEIDDACRRAVRD